MITVSTPPVVVLDRHGNWELVLWAGKWFDYTIPFRAILAEMVGTLGRHAGAELRLPEHEAWEDFIEGQLRFGPYTLGVYFEHSLGFLSLHHPNRAPLDEVWAILDSTVAVE